VKDKMKNFKTNVMAVALMVFSVNAFAYTQALQELMEKRSKQGDVVEKMLKGGGGSSGAVNKNANDNFSNQKFKQLVDAAKVAVNEDMAKLAPVKANLDKFGNALKPMDQDRYDGIINSLDIESTACLTCTADLLERSNKVLNVIAGKATKIDGQQPAKSYSKAGLDVWSEFGGSSRSNPLRFESSDRMPKKSKNALRDLVQYSMSMKNYSENVTAVSGKQWPHQ
jgi:uncharacterized protein YoxC